MYPPYCTCSIVVKHSTNILHVLCLHRPRIHCQQQHPYHINCSWPSAGQIMFVLLRHPQAASCRVVEDSSIVASIQNETTGSCRAAPTMTKDPNTITSTLCTTTPSATSTSSASTIAINVSNGVVAAPDDESRGGTTKWVVRGRQPRRACTKATSASRSTSTTSNTIRTASPSRQGSAKRHQRHPPSVTVSSLPDCPTSSSSGSSSKGSTSDSNDNVENDKESPVLEHMASSCLDPELLLLGPALYPIETPVQKVSKCVCLMYFDRRVVYSMNGYSYAPMRWALRSFIVSSTLATFACILLYYGSTFTTAPVWPNCIRERLNRTMPRNNCISLVTRMAMGKK